MKPAHFLLFWISSITQTTYALYSDDGDVNVLDHKTFNEHVKEKDHLSVVEFLYGHVRNMLITVLHGVVIARTWLQLT